MNEVKAKTEAAAKKEAIRISKKNEGKYVTLYACFGLFASVKSRLDIHEPSDSAFNWYVINGQVKQFTNAQTIADQNATPMMA